MGRFKWRKKGLGARVSPRDPRDYTWRALAAARGYVATEARAFYSMVDKSFRIDQGSEGTCVGHAITNVLLAGPTEHDAFPPFETEEKAHQYARALYLDASGDTTYQKGTWPGLACEVLRKRGTVGAYWRLLTVEDITEALLTHGPVSMTVPWYVSMYYRYVVYKDLGYYVRVRPESQHVGYHEIALTGVDLAPKEGPPFVRIQNSWGADWGSNGTGRILLSDLAKLNLSDTWAFTEAVF